MCTWKNVKCNNIRGGGGGGGIGLVTDYSGLPLFFTTKFSEVLEIFKDIFTNF